MNTKATCDHRLLRSSLIANGLFSGSCGLALLIFTERIGQMLGQVSSLLLWVIGCGLLIFASDIFYRLKRGLSVGRVWYFIANDVLWVVGSVVILLVRPQVLGVNGLWMIAAVALIVAAFGSLQFVGLKLGMKQPKQTEPF